MTTTQTDADVSVSPRTANSAVALRDIGAELARRVSNRLAGAGEAYERRIVLVTDADETSGTRLGSYTTPAWLINGRRFDMISIAIAHPMHRLPDGTIDAERVFTTLAHEIAHLYTEVAGMVGTRAPDHVEHTEDFAAVARYLGLAVLRRPNTPTCIFTPGLTTHGRAEFRDLIYRIACAGLHTSSGIQLAGPVGFTGTLTEPRAANAAAAPPGPSSPNRNTN